MRHRKVLRGKTVCSKDVGHTLHPSWRLVNIDITNAWNVKVLSPYGRLIAEPELWNLTSAVIRIQRISKIEITRELISAWPRWSLKLDSHLQQTLSVKLGLWYMCFSEAIIKLVKFDQFYAVPRARAEMRKLFALSRCFIFHHFLMGLDLSLRKRLFSIIQFLLS